MIEFYKFISVGFANTIFGLTIIYSLMFFLDLGPVTANLSGYLFGFIFGFFINKKWIFKSNDGVKKEFWLYLLVVAVSYVLNAIFVHTLIKEFATNSYVAQIGGMVVYSIMTLVGCKKIVFSKKELH
jgi:putative flippase GtrA